MAADAVDAYFSQFSSSSGASCQNVSRRVPQEPPAKRAKTVLDVSENAEEPAVAEAPDEYQDVVVEVYEGDTNCSHECVRPLSICKLPQQDAENGLITKPAATFSAPGSSRPPARVFPYTLDTFQETAIQCLEAGESVLVSAHTSAGKTTVAEYAIAMSLRDKQRVIYTSPIKALSNQKYRDLSNMYGNEVGLLTGDVSLNPSASVIVMTTEILRSMLYRGSEMVREMKWVIFDEIHYMRDRERGVVWEETIILLPDTVRLVFLSATIPNAREFTEWICRIKHQPCHAIYTDYRPVPLQHYLFPMGGDGVHLVMDETKQFREDQFHKAVAELTRSNDTTVTAAKPKSGKKSASDIEKIVLMCHERNYTPLIVFAFSKREVEANALSLKNVKLTTSDEEELIETVFNNAMDTLGEDRHLPQITCMLPLLKRGIGLHHGGLLPIVKEVIEILFQESLVKVLFSTETFSMGVNMPAKTVVFTKLKKWDGTAFRMISPGEYIQMSGRAGRRGLDTRGLSIIMLDEQLESNIARELFLGDPLRITSQFHLGYNMLLSLLRVEGANPEYMIQRSFYQFQQDKATLQLEEKKGRIDEQLAAWADIKTVLVEVDTGDALPKDLDLNAAIAEYYKLQHSVDQDTKELCGIMMQPKYVLRFLQVGRVVRVCDVNGKDCGYGVVAQAVQKQRVLKTTTRNSDDSNGEKECSESHFVVPVILKRILTDTQQPNDLPPKQETWDVVPCTLNMLQSVTQVVANVPVNVSTSAEAREAVGTILGKIDRQLKSCYPLLDPVQHMKIDVPRVAELQRDIENSKKTLESHPLHNHELLPKLYERFDSRIKLITEKQRIEQTLESQRHLVMKDDLRAMRRVLRKLDYLDDHDIVTLKGRAACEISSVDELVMGELLFHNVFHKLQTNDLMAMLSCFVFEEKSDEAPPTNPTLLLAYERVREVARRVAEVSVDAKLPVTVDEYVDKFKPALMEIVLKWMEGAKFADLGIPEDIFEGSVVRAIRRLEELLRQLISAAKSIGEQELEKRLMDAVLRIRRGIVFSASLYL